MSQKRQDIWWEKLEKGTRQWEWETMSHLQRSRSSRRQKEVRELEKYGRVQEEKQKDLGCYDKEIWGHCDKEGLNKD